MLVKPIASFILAFGIGGLYSAARMLIDGRIRVGPRGRPATDYVRRNEQPARFWRIFTAFVMLSIILLLTGLGFLTEILALPWK